MVNINSILSHIDCVKFVLLWCQLMMFISVWRDQHYSCCLANPCWCGNGW